jgi:hypothetical protein
MIKTKEIIYIIAILLLVSITAVQCNRNIDLQTDLEKSEVNIEAMQDTITASKTREGKLQYEKATFVTTEKGLRDLNADLAKEVAEQKGKVAQLNKIIAILSTPKPGPIGGAGSVSGKPCDSIGTYTASWESFAKFDENNFRKLAATTTITVDRAKVKNVITDITQDDLGFDLITGLEKKEGGYEIFVRSNYPGFRPTKIDGAFIPQKDLFPQEKKKRYSLGFGPQIGLGLSSTMQPTIYFGAGIGLQYSIFKF